MWPTLEANVCFMTSPIGARNRKIPSDGVAGVRRLAGAQQPLQAGEVQLYSDRKRLGLVAKMSEGNIAVVTTRDTQIFALLSLEKSEGGVRDIRVKDNSTRKENRFYTGLVGSDKKILGATPVTAAHALHQINTIVRLGDGLASVDMKVPMSVKRDTQHTRFFLGDNRDAIDEDRRAVTGLVGVGRKKGGCRLGRVDGHVIARKPVGKSVGSGR